MSSPTQRSTAYCRAQDWPYSIEERWVPQLQHKGGGVTPGHRKDLWGCIDLLVLDDEPGILAVQACAGASHATRAKKMRAALIGLPTPAGQRNSAALKRWVEKGNRLEVWSWDKQGARGKRKLWTLRRELILTFHGVPIEEQSDLR